MENSIKSARAVDTQSVAQLVSRFSDTEVRSCLPALLRLAAKDTNKTSFLAARALFIYARVTNPAGKVKDTDLSDTANIARVLATTQVASIRRMLVDFAVTPAQLLESYAPAKEDVAGATLAASLEHDEKAARKARKAKDETAAKSDGADTTARKVTAACSSYGDLETLRLEIEILRLRAEKARLEKELSSL